MQHTSPTPAAKEPMETFKPRVLTEPVVRRFFVKHNKGKLENTSFLPNLMKLSDGEIKKELKNTSFLLNLMELSGDEIRSK